MTKSQVDRLGARLRAGEVSDTDLRLLEEYRQSFAGAYDHVMRRLLDEFGLSPTGRAAKTTFAILGKLRRESARLSQIQDVAGCRVIVPDVPAQDELARALASAFELVSVIDRRERPSHGYRAVHLVVTVEGRTVEIQVRTTAQQLWAEISEKLSDRFGIEVKYGAGPAPIRVALDVLSDVVLNVGAWEVKASQMRERINASSVLLVDQARVQDLDHKLELIRASLRDVVTSIGGFEQTGQGIDVLSD